MSGTKPKNFCCERFKEWFDEGLIHYAYETTDEIDETDWYVEGFTHLYYCPYCGAFVKGRGFGNYEEKYPPVKGVKVVRQDGG